MTHPYYIKNKGWSSFDKRGAVYKYGITVDRLENNDIAYKFLNDELIEVRMKKNRVIKKKKMENSSLLVKRCIAFFIELLILGFLSGILGFIFEKTNSNYSSYLTYVILTILVFKDTVFQNGSIGKYLLKLKITDVSNNKKRFFIRKIIRNITVIFWPLEFIIILIMKRRLTDLILGLDIKNIGNGAE
ncbi:MAG: RDD family protein [Flavobacteriaceae bacterium]|nr:RDD family protein [Flavobacteriaceae bacterium]